MFTRRLVAPGTLVLCFLVFSVLHAGQRPEELPAEIRSLRAEAITCLRKACQFFAEKVAVEGGYVWRYSEDLSLREGEGRAGSKTAWVQPPGTPSVGMAFLQAYEATGDRFYLHAARQTGLCLVRGQLVSGGWYYRIEFDPNQRRRYAYRVDKPTNLTGRNNRSTLDDNTTQSALLFLMHLDKALSFSDPEISSAVKYGLRGLIAAQYPNGGWPQVFTGPADVSRCKMVRASYPAEWSREYPRPNYAEFYTFNDNAIQDAIAVLIEAWRIYRDKRFLEAAEKGGQFIIMAQMPDPQPAWAQQYDFDMHPAWARKFEPPAISGGESQSVLRTLLLLYKVTGNEKYLEPVPPALNYLERSALPDGRLARFYELETNRPLYFTKDYRLTYSDEDVPTHYAFKVSNNLGAIRREYEQLKSLEPAELKRLWDSPQRKPRLSASLIRRARSVIAALDGQGRWIDRGTLRTFSENEQTGRMISTETFIRNVRVLCDLILASSEDT